jgi:AcrR family transcriptional regulator
MSGGIEGRRPPPPRTERGEQTRRRLLEAAESVFGERGYHEASIVRITGAAGVGQGTFYLHFGSKKQIFEDLVDDLNHRVRRAMADAARHAPDRLEMERRGLEAFLRFTAEHPALYRIVMQAEFVSPRALHRHYERIAEGYTEGLRAAMDRGEIARGDPEVMAWMLMAVGEMAGMRWILWHDDREVPRAVLDEVMAFIGRSLGVSSAP